MGVIAEVPEAALVVGELRGDRAAVHVDDAVLGVAGVVLFHAFDQGGGDVGAAALHDEGDVLVGGALEGDQGVRRLGLVVEGDQLELAAEGAAAGVDVVDHVVELLEVLVADLGERTRERISVHDLDGLLRLGGCHRHGQRHDAGRSG